MSSNVHVFLITGSHFSYVAYWYRGFCDLHNQGKIITIVLIYNLIRLNNQFTRFVQEYNLFKLIICDVDVCIFTLFDEKSLITVFVYLIEITYI